MRVSKSIKTLYLKLNERVKALILVLFGVILAMIPTFIESNTLLFRSQLRLVIDPPPILTLIEKKDTESEWIYLMEAEFPIENKGFKTGRLTKAIVEPNDLSIVPKIKIIGMYRVEVPRLSTALGLVRFIVYISKETTEKRSFSIGFIDEYEHYAGKVVGYMNYKQNCAPIAEDNCEK